MPTVNPLCSIQLSAKTIQASLGRSEQIWLFATAPRADASVLAILSDTHLFIYPDSNCAHSRRTADSDPQRQQQSKEPKSSDDGQRTNSAPNEHFDHHEKRLNAERQSQVWFFHQQTEGRGRDDDEHSDAAATQDSNPVIAPPTGMRLATNHSSHLTGPIVEECLVGRLASADNGLDLLFRRDPTLPPLAAILCVGTVALEMLLFEVAVVVELHTEPFRTILCIFGLPTPAPFPLHPRTLIVGSRMTSCRWRSVRSTYVAKNSVLWTLASATSTSALMSSNTTRSWVARLNGL